VIGSARVGCASVFLFGSVETLQALVLPPLGHRSNGSPKFASSSLSGLCFARQQ